MSRKETLLARGLEAATEGRPEPSVVPDQYWQDISGQAAARLARLEEERTQRPAEDETRQPRRTHRLALMVTVGASLLAAMGYVLLKAVPSLALLP